MLHSIEIFVYYSIPLFTIILVNIVIVIGRNKSHGWQISEFIGHLDQYDKNWYSDS